MNSEDLRKSFLTILTREFPSVKNIKSEKNRVSTYIPNNKNNKRWMQLDAHPEYLSIVMDHLVGDIKIEDIKKLDLPIGLNGSNTAIQLSKNQDSVIMSVFCHEPYDFSNTLFLELLQKHFYSYLRRVKTSQDSVS
ncbi:MAG: hypothetical protein U9Q88_01545 [Bacillota bacterium]|nr:hypothetical protein [Bacillota bacterium]